jgi:hypothetical protein
MGAMPQEGEELQPRSERELLCGNLTLLQQGKEPMKERVSTIFSLVKREEAIEGSSDSEGSKDTLEIALQSRKPIEERPLAGKVEARLLVKDDLHPVQ